MELMKGKVNTVIDLSWGSSAKAQIHTAIANKFRPEILISNAATSASHTVVWGKHDIKFVFKALPGASVFHRIDDDYSPYIFLAPSAGFEFHQLIKEIKYCKIPKDKIIVSARAFVVQEHHKSEENYKMNCGKLFGSGESHLGSTSSGQSAAFYDKISRNKCYDWAGAYKELKEYATVVDYPEYSFMLAEMLDKGYTALAEMPQGFPLSIDYSIDVKKSTFRNINPLQLMSDLGLNVEYFGNVIGNTRVFPIRVSNRFINNNVDNVIAKVRQGDRHFVTKLTDMGMDYDDVNSVVDRITKGESVCFRDFVIEEIKEGLVGTSGSFESDMTEVSWKQLKEMFPNGDIEQELTTLTKLPRRIAVPNNSIISDNLMKKAMITIKPDYISMTFLNYVSKDTKEQKQFIDKVNEYLKKQYRVGVGLYQNGPDVDDVYFL